MRSSTRSRPLAPARTGGLLRRLPPTALVLVSIGSVQLGAALAKELFARLGPPGVVLLRVGVAALVLCALSRPRLAGHRRRDLALALAFGVVLGAMNLAFYEAIARIPLGVAVTIEFIGPLAVAVAGSRNARDVLWAVLAGAGVVLLTRGGGPLSATGIGFALLAGSLWGGYILLSQRVGRVFSSGAGLAIALAAAALVLAPAGIVAGGAALLAPGLLAAGVGVGLLSSAIPYSLELEALRRLPAKTFGVLMSLEPAAAALAGFAVLHETLQPRQLAAIAMVTVASVGAARAARAQAPSA